MAAAAADEDTASGARIRVELSGAQETLLIPLLGRADATRRGHTALIHDPKAVEMVSRLDYDFSKWEAAGSLPGMCARAGVFDDYVRAFITAHPRGVVVEIGCGLDTRFERVDNGGIHWVDLDLPDALALRRRFFEDGDSDSGGRRRMVAADVRDTAAWVGAVRGAVARGADSAVMFVSEAALIYLERADARRVLEAVAREFPHAWLALDTTSAAVVASQSTHELMKHIDPSGWFQWYCERPSEVAEWTGFDLAHAKTYMDVPNEVKDFAPQPWRFVMKYLPFLGRLLTMGYYMSLLKGSPRPEECSKQGTE